jgi:protein SCO1/2
MALLLALGGCDVSRATPADSAAAQPAEHDAEHDAGHDAATHDPATHRDLAAGEPSGFSIYHAGSRWTDQTGTALRLADLAGKPQVVAMVYTSCAYACPRIMLDMKRIEGELGGRADEVRFVLVSIDPERDTPERLAEFAAGSRLDPDRWTLLTGSEGDVLELAALLGVQYRQTSPGEWVHSNLITVLDREGVVVHRQLGLGTDPSETLKVLSAHLP